MQAAIIMIWLLHIAAVIGSAIGYETWFIELSPLNLLFCLVCIFVTHSYKISLSLLVPFIFGMIAEIIGVNSGLLFGNYTYGSNLGLKVFGVPWLIGVNWALLVFATAGLSRYLTKSLVVASLLGAAMMVLLDVFMELQAPRFDFWQFEGNHVPLRNYLDWFVIGAIAHFFYVKFAGEFISKLAVHLYFAFLIFFISYLFIPA